MWRKGERRVGNVQRPICGIEDDDEGRARARQEDGLLPTLPGGWSRQPVRTRVFIERNEFSSRQQAVREVAGRRQVIGGQWERKSESGQRLPGRTVARNERVPGSGNSNMSRPGAVRVCKL